MVPLFMGPMSGGATMPCPACSVDDGSPKRFLVSGVDLASCPDESAVQAYWSGGPVLADCARAFDELKAEWARQTEAMFQRAYSFRQEPINPNNVAIVDSLRAPLSSWEPVTIRAVPSDGWTLIDSEETARSFVGQCVEIRAPASEVGGGWGASPYNGQRAVIRAVNACDVYVVHGGTISWKPRGNVYLRRVTA